MSQVAPDIPELEHVPEPVRGLVWMRAQMRAIRSPFTHLIGLLSVGVGAALAGGLGLWMVGALGGAIGACLGVAVGVYFFLRVVMEWRTRRLVPVVEREVDWRTEFADLITAHERIARVAASQNRKDRPPV